MTWTFHENATPPAIEVNCPSGTFHLTHKYLDSDRRLQATEAIAAGITSVAAGQVLDAAGMTLGVTACWRVLAKHITGWDGVVDASGNSVPFKHRDSDSGQITNKLSQVLSQISPSAQLRVMAVQLAMNGVKFTRGLSDVFGRILLDDGEVKSIAEDAERFFRWREGTAAESSTDSVCGGIDTDGSASECPKSTSNMHQQS